MITELDVQWAQTVANHELTVADIAELKSDCEDWFEAYSLKIQNLDE